ncbi:MAG TPA: cytochrome c3 family protein [Thermoanaerobaculia bacterium]|nr:cytochrome c3 family protein [Thermoanaerobaculia bacterium]
MAATLILAAPHHGPDKTVIDDAAKKQPGVPFNHGTHATKLVARCDTCHHTQKDLTKDSEGKVPPCAECHLDPKQGVSSMREMSLQKNPLHSLCIDCHKEKKKGPTVCKDCHKK